MKLDLNTSGVDITFSSNPAAYIMEELNKLSNRATPGDTIILQYSYHHETRFDAPYVPPKLDASPFGPAHTAKVVKPGTPGSVTVAQILHRKSNFEQVLAEGLKTHTQHYFRAPFVSHGELDEKWLSNFEKWVAIEVDPNQTYVFNNELRTSYDQKYGYQRVTLADWLKQIDEVQELKRNNPCKPVLRDPYTGKPQVFDSWDHPAVNDPKWQGNWEIIVQKDLIPVELFCAHSKGLRTQKQQNIAQVNEPLLFRKHRKSQADTQTAIAARAFLKDANYVDLPTMTTRSMRFKMK